MGEKLRLPPLNALRVFHAVAQHRSFRRAAEELLVTPQAVGQQMKLLEDLLQVTLFARRGRSVELTESAILLSHFVQAGFYEFSEGVRRVTKPATRARINLNASPYFAARHLLPRLSKFHEVLQAADLRLTTMIDTPDFLRDEVDLSIQWGYEGGWPDYQSSLLVADPKIICCTPGIAAAISTPSDLAGVTLLEAVKATRLWTDILRHLKVEESGRNRSIGFDDAASMRHATLQGIGVGLLSVMDAEDDLRSGTLVAPFGRDALADMKADEVPGFHLVVPRSHLRVKAVAALHRWLVDQKWSPDA
jgi:LysR family glycine cleavage system transcriptional activator